MKLKCISGCHGDFKYGKSYEVKSFRKDFLEVYINDYKYHSVTFLRPFRKAADVFSGEDLFQLELTGFFNNED